MVLLSSRSKPSRFNCVTQGGIKNGSRGGGWGAKKKESKGGRTGDGGRGSGGGKDSNHKHLEKREDKPGQQGRLTCADNDAQLANSHQKNLIKRLQVENKDLIGLSTGKLLRGQGFQH